MVYPEFAPKVEYWLSDIGQGLAPVFLALLEWAELNRGKGRNTATVELVFHRSEHEA
jgi:DNA-binding HxlR family transcriptional regulator